MKLPINKIICGDVKKVLQYFDCERIVGFLTKKVDLPVDIGLILGSGLGSFSEKIEDSLIFAYSDIPSLPLPSVKGHDGKIIIGSVKKKRVLIASGRFHYYEGYRMSDITTLVRVIKLMGAKIIIVTNAAGGLNPYLTVGSVMLISDHINLMGNNPLIGRDNILNKSKIKNKRTKIDNEFSIFIDMSNAYDLELRQVIHSTAEEEGIAIKEGVLAAVYGPSYETPAEQNMLKLLGADAVCMSTVPEVLEAVYQGLKVIGLSLIVNNTLEHKKVSHLAVIETARRFNADFIRLLEAVIRDIPL